MATSGVYGTNIPVDVEQSDIDIYYTYRETISDVNDDNLTFKKLDSSILVKAKRETTDSNDIDSTLEGMYNLQLPLDKFNKKGFYTIYIKPKEYKCVIADVGVLQSYPDVRGIVFDTSTVDDSLRGVIRNNNSLVGYRVIYLDSDTKERSSLYRIVTSNNLCEPLTQNLTNTTSNIITYRFNQNSTLSFVTLTPSTAPSFKSNESPYIGQTSQQVLLVNTKFEPIMIELEMVDHDADTISTMLEGNQLRDLDNGLITTFNNDDEIYNQSEFYTLKDQYTGVPIYEVKKNKQNEIDFGQTITDK